MDTKTALALLERAIDHAGGQRADTPEIRAALRALLPRSTTRDFLDWYWRATSSPDPIGRVQNMRAALNGIERHLR